MNFKNIKFTIVAWICFVTCGCITSVDKQYCSIACDPNKIIAKKRISYCIRSVSRSATDGNFNKNEGVSFPIAAYAVPEKESDAIAVFQHEFGIDATAINQERNRLSGDYDIHIDILRQNVWNPLGMFGAFISGFTWLIIPSWADDTSYLFAEVYDKEGEKRTYQLGGVVHTYVWLPFVFAMPFDVLPSPRMHELTKDQWHELHMRMRADGFFE